MLRQNLYTGEYTMFFWNRRKQLRKAQEAEQARKTLKEGQDAEQIRLGEILFQTLHTLAAQNKNLPGNQRIYATHMVQNAGNNSVIIMFEDDGHRECMMQFDINVAANKLSCVKKYRDAPQFTCDRFEEFVQVASTMVRDFR